MTSAVHAVSRIDKWISAGAILVLLAAGTALARGQTDWGKVPHTVWLHLGTVILAMVLTPVMLLRQRGDRWHRWLGRIWVAALFLTALASMNLRQINHGQFSVIHILSLWTMFQAPMAMIHARSGRIDKHRSSVRGLVIGGLVIAGLFTFTPDRLLGHWLLA